MPESEKRRKNETLLKAAGILNEYSFLLFLYGTGVLMTLFYKNAYFDILESKAAFFVFLMEILDVLMIFLLCWKAYRKEIKVSMHHLPILCLFVCSAISTVFSFSQKDAFSGIQGWNVGFFAIASLILCLFVYKDNRTASDRKFYIPIFTVCFFEFVLIITDSMGLDLLKMRLDLDPYSHYFFFATLGNSNWCTGYLSLFVPLFICLYVSCENMKGKVYYFILSLTGLISCVLIGSDGIYLAMGMSAFVIIPLIVNSKENLKRFSILILSFAFGIILMKIFLNRSSFLTYYNGVGILFFNEIVICLVFLCAFLSFLIGSKIDETKYCENKKTVLICSEAVYMVVLFVIVISVIRFRGDELDNYRFELWKISLERFKDFDLFRKLFGLGPELQRNLYSSMYEKYGIVYTVSHSEMIQVLVSMGIMGLISWFFSWLSILFSVIRKGLYQKPFLVGIYAGVFAYFGQSFVNSATLLNLCILLVYAINILASKKG